MIRNNKCGFILPLTIILLVICSLALGIALKYMSFATQMTKVYLNDSVCRLAAQSAIESAKRDIYKAFYANGISIPFPQMDVHLDGVK